MNTIGKKACALVATAILSFTGLLAAPAKTAELDPAWAKMLVQVKSTLDGTLQPCYFWAPEAAKTNAVPLVVGLHTWSADYRQTSHYATVLKYAREKGWAMVGPNFRGPNKTPPACGGLPSGGAPGTSAGRGRSGGRWPTRVR